jgi:hypothetical protein
MPLDVRGTPIQAGSRVAFNRSGNVIIGTVVGLTYDRRFPAKIRADNNISYGRGKLSTVRNPYSVLVLRAGDV